MKIPERIAISESLETFPFADCTIDEHIKLMQCMKAKHTAKFHTIRLVAESWGYDGGWEMVVYGDRWENDDELNARALREFEERQKTKARREKAAAKELKEYQRLRAKYGDKQ